MGVFSRIVAGLSALLGLDRPDERKRARRKSIVYDIRPEEPPQTTLEEQAFIEDTKNGRPFRFVCSSGPRQFRGICFPNPEKSPRIDAKGSRATSETMVREKQEARELWNRVAGKPKHRKLTTNRKKMRRELRAAIRKAVEAQEAAERTNKPLPVVYGRPTLSPPARALEETPA